jgi:hypothetical protein
VELHERVLCPHENSRIVLPHLILHPQSGDTSEKPRLVRIFGLAGSRVDCRTGFQKFHNLLVCYAGYYLDYSLPGLLTALASSASSHLAIATGRRSRAARGGPVLACAEIVKCPRDSKFEPRGRQRCFA